MLPPQASTLIMELAMSGNIQAQVKGFVLIQVTTTSVITVFKIGLILFLMKRIRGTGLIQIKMKRIRQHETETPIKKVYSRNL